MEQEGNDYKPTKLFMQMLANDEFYGVLQELVDFGISRYERDYKNTYDQTDLVLYQKYTYEDVCRLLNWEQNEVPLNIGGYKFDKRRKHFLFSLIMIKQRISVIPQNMKIILYQI